MGVIWPSPHDVHLVIYPGAKALEAIGPMSVFGYADQHLRQHGQPDGYAVQIAALQAGPVRSGTLMTLEASQSLRFGRGRTGLHRGGRL